MGWILLVLIIGLPVLEIAVFVKTAGAIGVLPTLALAILAGLAGMAILRGQGLATALRARSLLERGVMPVAEVFDGLCLMVAGGLMLLPGFVSDGLGLLLLLPPVRAALRRLLAGRMQVEPAAAMRDPYHHHPGPGGHPRPGPGAGVIEGEFHEIPESPDRIGDPPPRRREEESGPERNGRDAG